MTTYRISVVVTLPNGISVYQDHRTVIVHNLTQTSVITEVNYHLDKAEENIHLRDNALRGKQ